MSKLTFAEIDQIKREHPVTKVAGAIVSLRAQRQGKFPWSGPCPLHSPDKQAADSTSFACDDDAWVCTECGGGDVITLTARLNDLDPDKDFRKAVDILTGGAPVKPLSAEEARAIEQAAAEEKAMRLTERNEYRDRQQRAAWDVYYKFSIHLSHPAAKIGRAYLFDVRGLRLPDTVWLRFNPQARFYVPDKPKPRLIHTGPAITAAIQRQENGQARFTGVHMTFIDLTRPKGKALIVDPKTDDVHDCKKVRGSMHGGHVDLTGWLKDPRELVLGEGTEKVGAVWSAMLEGGRDVGKTGFWSAMNRGNLGGPHADLVPHPSTKTATGRVQRVPGPEPHPDKPAIDIPDTVERLVLLGDTTSDRFTGECVMARAAARYAKPGREIVCAWGPGELDFDDLLREAS